jgi:hypothetical protein
MLRTFVAALAVLLLVPEAGAQVFKSAADVVQGSTLYSYIATPAHSRELAAAAGNWDAMLQLQPGCKSNRSVFIRSIDIAEPVEMPAGAAYPLKGVYQVRFDWNRCGQTQAYTVIGLAKPGAKPMLMPLYPGESITGARLFMDAGKSAQTLAIMLLGKAIGGTTCDKFLLTDTRVTRSNYEADFPGRGRAAGAWDEAWTYRGCGAEARLQVTFVPDGKGGTSFAAKAL